MTVEGIPGQAGMTVEGTPVKLGMTVEGIPGQAGDDELFYWFKIGVRFVWIEDLVAVHYCYKIFGI